MKSKNLKFISGKDVYLTLKWDVELTEMKLYIGTSIPLYASSLCTYDSAYIFSQFCSTN